MLAYNLLKLTMKYDNTGGKVGNTCCGSKIFDICGMLKCTCDFFNCIIL